MNKRQWTGLLMVYIGYLFLGATVFYHIEQPPEFVEAQYFAKAYTGIGELIEQKCNEDHELYSKLEEYCGKPIRPGRNLSEVAPRIWDYYNAFFFVITVVSTIGYGNLHPTMDYGRVLMILYGIIGIPLNGILLTSLGQFFGAVFLRAHKKYKNHDRYGDRLNLAINILTYLIPGMIFFIFLPAGIISYFEEWTYIEAVYFAFVTLTTIGFGDLVAGQRQDYGQPQWAVLLYKILLLCWIIFGLGYLIMLLGFVAQAMNSKRLKNMEQKLVTSLTHSRMWHGFSKDIGYLRRLINEVYLDKLKPVFRDDISEAPQVIHRSKSLPDLIFTPSEEEAARLRIRKRAMSENVPSLVRMLSESDLQRIDKNATFAAAAAVPSTAELMRKVIDVYSGMKWPSTEDDENEEDIKGVDGFSDDEVLASERKYDQQTTLSARSLHPSSLFFVPSYEDTVSRQPHRGRAMSECPPPGHPKNDTPSTNPAGAVDWTWSGPAANKLHDIIRQRNKQKIMMGINKNRKGSLSQSVISGAKLLNPMRLRKRYSTESEEVTKSSSDIKDPKNSLPVPKMGVKRRSLQENRPPEVGQRNSQYMTTTAAMGAPNSPEADLLKLYSRGGSLFNEANRKDLFEETSIADFLRVLTNLHSRVGERIVNIEQNEEQQQQQPRPKRKLGTASLTPPRIRSLLDLFEPPVPSPSPRLAKKRKPSRIINLFRSDSKMDNVSTQAISTDTAEKPTNEGSHIKKLGRFLLRSYSIVPKDVEEAGTSRPHNRRKRFSLWPSESDDRDIPPFRLQVDSPAGSMQSLDVIIPIDPADERQPSISTPSQQRANFLARAGLLPSLNPAGGATNENQRTPASVRKNSFRS